MGFMPDFNVRMRTPCVIFFLVSVHPNCFQAWRVSGSYYFGCSNYELLLRNVSEQRPDDEGRVS